MKTGDYVFLSNGENMWPSYEGPVIAKYITEYDDKYILDQIYPCKVVAESSICNVSNKCQLFNIQDGLKICTDYFDKLSFEKTSKYLDLINSTNSEILKIKDNLNESNNKLNNYIGSDGKDRTIIKNYLSIIGNGNSKINKLISNIKGYENIINRINEDILKSKWNYTLQIHKLLKK